MKGPSLLIKNIAFENDQLLLAVESTNDQACCPSCTEQSQSLHSTYWRYPHYLPWVSLPVILQIKVKRFFCSNQDCSKRTFAERFPDLVGWYAQRTQRVIEKQQRLCANNTARTDELLLKDGRISLSDTSINRLMRGLPEPELPPVRVLGVDDWAKRKGQ